MFFGFIFARILFITCMIFILGYVFGNFSASRTLTTITKVASVLAIVLFIASNIFFARFGRGWRSGHRTECLWHHKDSTANQAQLNR